MLKKKQILAILSVAIILIMNTAPNATAFFINEDELYADHAIVVCLENNQVLLSKNADVKARPASMTKICTAIVVLDNCHSLEEKITVQKEPLLTLKDENASSIGLKIGEILSVESLMHYMLIASASDAAVVLAYHFGHGSIDSFVKMMNKTAEEIGCKNTHFTNPVGLDRDEHYTTAEDMEKLAARALLYPDFARIVKKASYTVPATNVRNANTIYSTNHMLFPFCTYYYNKYVCGVKTGSTSIAGRNVTTCAEKDGLHYVAVVMHAWHRDMDGDGNDENEAFMDSKLIYDRLFEETEPIRDFSFPADAELPLSDKHISIGKDGLFIMPKKTDRNKLETEFHFNEDNTQEKTFKKDERILGKVSYIYEGDVISEFPIISRVTVVNKLVDFRYFIYLFVIIIVLLTVIIYCIKKKKRNKAIQDIDSAST